MLAAGQGPIAQLQNHCSNKSHIPFTEQNIIITEIEVSCVLRPVIASVGSRDRGPDNKKKFGPGHEPCDLTLNTPWS